MHAFNCIARVERACYAMTHIRAWRAHKTYGFMQARAPCCADLIKCGRRCRSPRRSRRGILMVMCVSARVRLDVRRDILNWIPSTKLPPLLAQAAVSRFVACTRHGAARGSCGFLLLRAHRLCLGLDFKMQQCQSDLFGYKCRSLYFFVCLCRNCV